VASRDEIRTFSLPALTSGPLYRVPGMNAAVAPVAGTTRAVVAQGASLAVVDLAGVQDREGLKILDRTETGAAVRQLVASPDEAAALAVTDGGEALDVAFDPLRVAPRGRATAAAWPGTAPAPPPAPSPPVEASAAPAAGVAAATPPPQAEPVLPPPPAAEPEKLEEKADPPPPEPASPSPPPVAPPPPATVEHAEEKAPPPAAEPPSGPGTVRGLLTGPDVSDVDAVIALGPDNVLKQAARVAPDAAGRFLFTGLAPGAYRIVAAGKNGRVLVCDPPYVTIRLGPGESAEAPALSVQKGY